MNKLCSVFVALLLFSSMARADLSNFGLFDANGNPIVLGQSAMSTSLPIAIANNQSAIPVTSSNIDTSPATQNITALDSGTSSLTGANGQVFYFGTPTANSAATFTLSSQANVNVEASLLGGGGTLVVEVSTDGGAFWFRPNVFQISTQNYTNSFVAPFSATVNVSGFTQIRVRAITSWSGTATITIKETINPKSFIISESLPPGTNSIGQVTANAGTNLNTSALALSATQTNGTQKTQAVDGSGNVAPAGDVAARASFTKVTDGTNTTAVKAASTAAVAADPSAVVALSPNSPLPTGSNTIGTAIVIGNVASGSSDSGAPVKVGGVFHSSTQTFSDGQRADLQQNIHGLPLTDSSLTDLTGTFTSTSTTAAIDASGYASIAFTVDVSSVSGTLPTLDIQQQESDDGVNDWVDTYDADRLTASGSYKSMRHSLNARYYRFRYVIGGTSPSFTVTVRTTLKVGTAVLVHNFNKFNDLVMTAANNFSSILNLEGCGSSVVELVRGSGGAGVSVSAQTSNDQINWIITGTAINTAASTSYLVTNGPPIAKYARFTNTNNQAAATTLDIKYYCKE